VRICAEFWVVNRKAARQPLQIVQRIRAIRDWQFVVSVALGEATEEADHQSPITNDKSPIS
jgi:hypothetical protein